MKTPIEWHIIVDHHESGHPVSRIEFNFEAAAKTFDMMCEKYQKRTVRLFTVVREEVKKRGPILTSEERRQK